MLFEKIKSYFVLNFLNSQLPGMASSLSSVPPVKLNPRPDTIGTFNPQAAKAGASTWKKNVS